MQERSDSHWKMESRLRLRYVSLYICFIYVTSNLNETNKEYYYKVHNIVLQNPSMPGIRTQRGDVIPFELCDVVAGQLFKKPLTPEMSQAVLKSTTIRPDKRFDTIMQGVQVC